MVFCAVRDLVSALYVGPSDKVVRGREMVARCALSFIRVGQGHALFLAVAGGFIGVCGGRPYFGSVKLVVIGVVGSLFAFFAGQGVEGLAPEVCFGEGGGS